MDRPPYLLAHEYSHMVIHPGDPQEWDLDAQHLWVQFDPNTNEWPNYYELMLASNNQVNRVVGLVEIGQTTQMVYSPKMNLSLWDY
jgi:hypothetical protein